jgi:hypothetical protein
MAGTGSEFFSMNTKKSHFFGLGNYGKNQGKKEQGNKGVSFHGQALDLGKSR